MKSIACLVFAICLSTIAQETGSPVPPAQTAQTSVSPEAIAQEYIRYWNTGNFEALKPYIAPFYMTSHAHKIVADQQMLKRVVGTWRESIPDLDLKVQDTIVQGNKVVMRILITGTYKKRMFPSTIQPIPEAPTRHIRATEILIFAMKDGKIHEMWEEYDELALRLEMGAQLESSEKLDAQQAKEYPSRNKAEKKSSQ